MTIKNITIFINFSYNLIDKFSCSEFSIVMLNQIIKDSNNWKGTMMAKKKAKKKVTKKKKATKKKKKWRKALVTSLPVTWIRDFSFLSVDLIGWFNFTKISPARQAMRKTEDFTKRKSSVFLYPESRMWQPHSTTMEAQCSIANHFLAICYQVSILL